MVADQMDDKLPDFEADALRAILTLSSALSLAVSIKTDV